jgi:hypothetical protein
MLSELHFLLSPNLPGEYSLPGYGQKASANRSVWACFSGDVKTK